METKCPQCLELVDVDHKERDSECPVCGCRISTAQNQSTPRDGLEAGFESVDQKPKETASYDPEVLEREALDELQRYSKQKQRDLPHVDGYEIHGELGRGGMAVVYHARHLRLDRAVALKMMLSGVHASPREFVRFEREARAVARLQHPNILQIFEVGTQDSLPYFALEYVEGKDLGRLFRREPQEARKAAMLLETISRAVHYAHTHGVVHRDLKPANVLMTRSGIPKVADFGLAKRQETDEVFTEGGQVLGSPNYMAPEQARGDNERVGPLADVYGLGAILFEALTGQPPFVGATSIDVLRRVVEEEPIPPRRLVPKIPVDLETICLKCLAKETARRYQSAEALADDLKRFLEERPIVARPVSTLEHGWRWARRNPAWATVGMLVVTIAVVSSLLSWRLVIRTREAETAQGKEAQARAKAVEARDDAVAQKEIAQESRNLSVDVLRAVVLTIDDQLRSDPALAEPRQRILKIAADRLDRVRDHAEEHELIERTDAGVFQRMGDMYRKANRVSDAAEAYKQSVNILKRILDKDPTDPVAVRNVAAVTNLQADVELRLGNAQKAREMYEQALELRRRWHSMSPNDLNPVVALAVSHGLIGKASIALGEPKVALAHYLAAQAKYADLPADQRVLRPAELILRTNFTLQLLGECHYRLGDFASAEKLFREALHQLDALLKQYPQHPILLRETAMARQGLADFLLNGLEQPEAALVEYEQSQAALSKRWQSANTFESRNDLAGAHYRLGVTLDHLPTPREDEADQHYRECLKLRKELREIDPADTKLRIDLMLALGRAGHAEEAQEIARELSENVNPNDRRLLFQAACGLSVASQSAADKDLAKQCRNQSFELLKSLKQTGWRDVVSIEKDLDLEAVRQDERFSELLAAWKADVN